MKITAISPDSWQLTRWGLMNCYLVREHGANGEPDSFTLIDTTLGGAAPDILAAAESLGAPIRRILLTHAHQDHVGSVDALATKLPGVVLATTERSLPLLYKPIDKSRLPNEPQDTFAGSLPGITTPVTHFVADGELFGSLRCIFSPGHIPGHVAFLDERDGTLYAGDALVTVGRLSVCGWTPWYFPLPSVIMWNKPLALLSARRLATHLVQRFACGHGPIREGGVPALQSAIQYAESLPA